MHKVIKKDGMFFLEPDALIAAKAESLNDLAKVRSEHSAAELNALLERILLRLQALEGQSKLLKR